MKKITLFVAIAVCSAAVQAQISVGAQVGVNFGLGHSGKNSFGAGLTPNPSVGLLVGMLADLPVVEKISFRPEFNFIQKGSKYGVLSNIGSSTSSTKTVLNYVELPLNVVYKMPIGNGANKLYFGLGPAFGFGINGKSKSSSGNVDIKFNGNPDQFKRVDVGLNILAGYQLKNGLFGKAGYTLGFSDIAVNDDKSYKNRGFNICIGFLISAKK